MATTCSKCETEVEAADSFCRDCGNSLKVAAMKWHHRRGVVFVLLFCVLGPLAMRMLWASPAFNTRERVLFSIASVGQLLLIATLLMRAYVSYMLNIAGLDQL